MIEIRINKEIGNYEPKFVGPFTIRQTICVIIALPLCVVIYKSTAPHITGDLAGFLCAIPAGLAALFGWVKPYGMPTEKFIRSIFITVLFAPTNRRYKTKNYHESMLASLKAACEESHNAISMKNRKRKREKKPKYKVSTQAVK